MARWCGRPCRGQPGRPTGAGVGWIRTLLHFGRPIVWMRGRWPSSCSGPAQGWTLRESVQQAFIAVAENPSTSITEVVFLVAGQPVKSAVNRVFAAGDASSVSRDAGVAVVAGHKPAGGLARISPTAKPDQRPPVGPIAWARLRSQHTAASVSVPAARDAVVRPEPVVDPETGARQPGGASLARRDPVDHRSC